MIHIAATIYGDWHRTVFMKKALPSYELETLGVPAKFWIWTRENEVGSFLEAKHEIDKVMPCEIVGGDLPLGYKNGWQQTGDRAEVGDLVMQLQPDIIWSKGSFAHFGELVRSGKRMIYCPQPRGTEPFYAGSMTSRELMRIVHEDAHPVNKSEEANSLAFTRHPEIILWPIKGGWVTRTFGREPLIRPAKMFFNHQNLPSSRVYEEELAMVESSDKACGVSLCKRDVELDHYRNSNMWMNPERVGEFARGHSSSMTYSVAKKPSLLLYDEPDPEELSKVISESDGFVEEFMRFLVIPKRVVKPLKRQFN